MTKFEAAITAINLDDTRKSVHVQLEVLHGEQTELDIDWPDPLRFNLVIAAPGFLWKTWEATLISASSYAYHRAVKCGVFDHNKIYTVIIKKVVTASGSGIEDGVGAAIAGGILRALGEEIPTNALDNWDILREQS